MKHKRQTLSKDDPEIKDSKSKSESSLNEDKTLSCQTPHGAVKEEDDGPGVKKEDLSDQENSESVSSIPDSEDGAERGEDPAGQEGPPRLAPRLAPRPLHSPLASPGGPGPLGPGPRAGHALPASAGLAKSKLTALVNLSPTPKSLLAGRSPPNTCSSAPAALFDWHWPQNTVLPAPFFAAQSAKQGLASDKNKV
jgi:hypothetical protein